MPLASHETGAIWRTPQRANPKLTDHHTAGSTVLTGYSLFRRKQNEQDAFLLQRQWEMGRHQYGAFVVIEIDSIDKRHVD